MINYTSYKSFWKQTNQRASTEQQNSHCKLHIPTSNAYEVYFIITIYQNVASYLQFWIDDLLSMSKPNARWFITFRLKFLLRTQWFMSFRLNSSFRIFYRRHNELVCRGVYLVADAVSVYNLMISLLLCHLQSRYLLDIEQQPE